MGNDLIRSLVFALFMLVPTILLAEVPKKAQQLTIDQGLSQSTVGSVYIAHDGRIWFATGDGISIYDGQSFAYLYRDTESREGLQGNYTRTIFEDTDGRIWVGTYGGGISVFDQEANFLFGLRKENGDIPAIDIYDIAQAADGAVWVASEAGTFRLRKKADGYQLDMGGIPELLAHAPSRSVIVSRSGEIFAATATEGLLRFDPSLESIRQFTPDNSAFPTKAVLSLLEVESGDIWIGTEDAGVVLFSSHEEHFDSPLALPDQNIPAIFQASDGRIWFGSDANGVFVFDPSTGGLENYQFREGQPFRISSNSILALAEDGMGRMWIGTADGGASSVSVFPDSFETYYPDQEGTYGPISGVIWAIEEGQQGELWIGTKRGLSRFWQKDRRFESLDLGAGSRDIRVILRRGTSLLLGIRDRGLVELDPATLATRDIRGPDGENLFDGIYIRLLLEAGDGTLWVGTHSGVYHLNASLQIIQHFNADGVPGSLPHSRTRSLYEASDGTLWVGTSGGLSRYDPETGSFFTYSGQSFLPDDDVRSVFQPNPSTVYAGTQGGVAIVDLASGQSRFVLRKQGLPNETLYSLLQDGKGALWITTNNGLARFDLETEKIRVYRARDGLQGAEFNFNAHKLLSDGRIVVGGINGFSIFDPEKLATNNLPPRLAFQGPVDHPSKGDPQDVLVGSAPQTLHFELGVHHYDEPSENRLRWKLEPVDAEWNEAKGVSHTILRENLLAGDYTLRAIGLSAAGVESEGIVYSIRIEQSAWLRWYALLSYVWLAALCIMSLLWLRTRQISRRNVELELQVAGKTSELLASNAALQATAQDRASFYSRTAHEIRTPLSLIRAPLQSVLGGKTLSVQDRRHAEIIQRATQRLVQIADEMAAVSNGAIEMKAGRATVDFVAFLSPILELYRESAATKGVTLNSGEVPSKAATFDHGAAETVLHNLLSNAVKYTPPGGKIEFTCQVQPSSLDFAIHNDGPSLTDEAATKLKDYAYRGDLPTAQRGLELIGASIRAAGGALKVESDRANIKVSLPAHIAEDEYQSVKTSTTSGGDRILVIEDDRELREYLAELLSPLAEVQTVASLAAARRAVEGQVFDLVLCDVMLPDGNGFDFGKRMKEQIETSHISLVFLTALGDDPSYEKGLAAWADDYLTKPFDPSELFAKIRIRLRSMAMVRLYLMKQLSNGASDIESSPAFAPLDERFIERFQSFLEGQVGNCEASLEDAAKDCNMSKRALQRKLESLYGNTFSSLLAAARMRHAAKLLKTGKSVSEVATACGYQSLSSFSRQFSHTHHLSPRNFVKKSSS